MPIGARLPFQEHRADLAGLRNSGHGDAIQVFVRSENFVYDSRGERWRNLGKQLVRSHARRVVGGVTQEGNKFYSRQTHQMQSRSRPTCLTGSADLRSAVSPTCSRLEVRSL